MAAMRARPLAAATFLLLAGACGGEPAPPSATPTAGLTASIDLPPDAPRTFGAGVDADDLPMRELVPPGAAAGASWAGSVSSDAEADRPVLVVSWSRGDPAAGEVGLEIWERSDATAADPWRVVYAVTDPPDAGVYGVRFDVGDVTADGSPDVLSFEDMGGSGGCGTWRVIEMAAGSYTERYRKQTCDTMVRVVGGDLQVRTAVFGPEDAHCCPSAFRTTTLRWNGSAWDVVERTREPAPG
jgi:hypothetical protein